MRHIPLTPDWQLVGSPLIGDTLRGRLRVDFDRFAEAGLPAKIEEYIAQEYHIDLSSSLASFPLKSPFGKGSGQLSMTTHQVEEDANTGLGFVILKTVIAQDESGDQAMHEWAIQESKMVPERIAGKRGGREGWTISWKGRGWWQSFEAYLELIRESASIGSQHRMLVVPSCKYQLPTNDDEPWKVTEYQYTTQRMEQAWRSSCPDLPMPLEKDFSPTLAASDRAKLKAKIFEWMAMVPKLVRESATHDVCIGLKLFNAVYEDEFQIELLRAVIEASPPSRPDFITYANRLFDPAKVFEGKTGIAFGGPDLSDRNLACLETYGLGVTAGEFPAKPICISATGDIHSGRMAMEYALRGCSSFQLHTLFQLPASEYVMKHRPKVERALHQLYFDPEEGLIAWIHHWGKMSGLQGKLPDLAFRDLVGGATTGSQKTKN